MGLGVCPLTCLDVARVPFCTPSPTPAVAPLAGVEQDLALIRLPTGEAEPCWAGVRPPPPRASRTKEDGNVKVLFSGS